MSPVGVMSKKKNPPHNIEESPVFTLQKKFRKEVHLEKKAQGFKRKISYSNSRFYGIT